MPRPIRNGGQQGFPAPYGQTERSPKTAPAAAKARARDGDAARGEGPLERDGREQKTPRTIETASSKDGYRGAPATMPGSAGANDQNIGADVQLAPERPPCARSAADSGRQIDSSGTISRTSIAGCDRERQQHARRRTRPPCGTPDRPRQGRRPRKILDENRPATARPTAMPSAPINAPRPPAGPPPGRAGRLDQARAPGGKQRHVEIWPLRR